MKNKTKNSCYTYFRIVGNFDPDEISAILQLTPEEQWKIGDYRENGTQFDFASWEIGRCTDYDVSTKNQMWKTIALLTDKTEQLKQIRSAEYRNWRKKAENLRRCSYGVRRVTRKAC